MEIIQRKGFGVKKASCAHFFGMRARSAKQKNNLTWPYLFAFWLLIPRQHRRRQRRTQRPTQPPAPAMATPTRSPTHSNTYTPPAPSCQAQTIIYFAKNNKNLTLMFYSSVKNINWMKTSIGWNHFFERAGLGNHSIEIRFYCTEKRIGCSKRTE